jgi:parvulin-like peptidyl-prolyl isomerase
MGRTEDALTSYRQAVANAPDDPQVYRSLGFMAAEVDSIGLAVGAWRKALELFPDDLEVLARLAQTYVATGNLDLGQEAYQKLVEKAPQSAQAHYVLGQILMQKGDLDAARIELEKSIELKPDWKDPRLGLALVLMQARKTAEARAVYERVLEIDPNDAAVHNNIGLIHALQGELAEAEAAYGRAIAHSQDGKVLADAQRNLEIVRAIRAGKMRVRHILVASEQKAQEVLERLGVGEDFAELARKHSIDPSGKDGGNLGFFSPGDLHPDFESAVTKLDVGETSGVVKTPLGYHIINRIN